jgi:putative aldouronate transport system substrate-binding protein
MNAFIYWDSGNIYNVTDNGQVYSPIVQDAYREGLKYITKLYSEGLIGEMSYTGASYTDFVNMNTPQDQVAKVGIWTGHPSIYTDANTTILDEYAALPYLQDAGTGLGGYTVFGENTIKFCSWIMQHTEGTGADEAAMKFLDLMYTDEAMTRMRMGEKDVYWHYGEEGLNIKGEKTTIYVDDDSAFFGGDSTWGRNGNCIMNDANYTGVTGQATPGTRSAEIDRLLTELWENVCVAGKRPANKADNLVYTSEEFAIREDLYSRYWSYYSEALTLFVTGKNDINDDAKWNEYKAELDKLGRVKLEGVAQRAFNREQGK